ncbi:MAG: hypothetical protein J6V44_11850 [Methanobrevibacter sp.]|nr:hypothetical protein [Methanobrevibacter sp.]
MNNEQELMEFVQFCAEMIPEFKGKSPEEIAKALDELSQSNPEAIQQLFAEFKKVKQGGSQPAPKTMFRKGGKIDQLVNKFKKGGKATKKCSCGCDLVKVAEKGGIVEKCACGCKQVTKAQEGTKTTPAVDFSKYKLTDSKINGQDTTMKFSTQDGNMTIKATPEGRRIDQYNTYGAGNMFRKTYTNNPGVMDRFRTMFSPMNNRLFPMSSELNQQIDNVMAGKGIPVKK